MKIDIHISNDARIAEITSGGEVISNLEDATDLMGNLYYQETDRIILHEKNITPAFFDLKTQLAGNILQKFSNYRMRLAIVGDFAKYPGDSLKDFIRESNKGRKINFVPTVSEAISALSQG